MLKIILGIGFLQVIIMAVLLVRTKVLAVLLGPEGVGVMAVIDRLLALITQTASLSLPFAALRFLPSVWSDKNSEYALLFRQMRNVLILLTSIAVITALAVNTYYPSLWGKELYKYRSLIFVAIACIPIISFWPFLQNSIAGRLQHNYSMYFVLAHAIVFTSTGIVGVWWMGLPGLYFLYAIFGFFLILPVIVRVGKTIDNEHKDHPFSLNMPRKIWKFSAALFALSFIAPFAVLQIHYLVLKHFGAETNGWMQAAIGISLAPRGVLGAASAVFLTPNVNRGGTPEERMAWAAAFNKIMILLSLVIALPFLLYPDLFVQLLYSQHFLPGASFVALFVIGEIVALIAGTYQAVVIALDQITYHVFQNIVAQLVILGVGIMLIEPYGILGAGIAMLSAQIFLFGATTFFLWFKYRLKIPVANLSLLLFVLVSMVLGSLLGVSQTGFSIDVLLLKSAVYLILVAGLWFFLTSVEKEKCWGFVNKVRMRFSTSR